MNLINFNEKINFSYYCCAARFSLLWFPGQLLGWALLLLLWGVYRFALRFAATVSVSAESRADPVPGTVQRAWYGVPRACVLDLPPDFVAGQDSRARFGPRRRSSLLLVSAVVRALRRRSDFRQHVILPLGPRYSREEFSS
jgi:hypothetical protein